MYKTVLEEIEEKGLRTRSSGSPWTYSLTGIIHNLLVWKTSLPFRAEIHFYIRSLLVLSVKLELIALRMIIFLFLPNLFIYTFCGLTLCWVCHLLTWRNKKWKDRLNPEAPVLHICVPHAFVRALLEERPAVFHVAHTSWPLMRLWGLFVLPGPSGIGDLLIVLGLNLTPWEYNPAVPWVDLPWPFPDRPLCKQQWFQLLLFARGRDHHIFSPQPGLFLSPHHLKV